MSGRPGDTVKFFTDAQAKIVGRFCTNCRLHRQVDGGRTIAKGKRWVCRWCAQRYDEARNVRGIK